MNLIGRIERLEAHQSDRDTARELDDLLGIEGGTPDYRDPLQCFAKAISTNGVDGVLAYVRALADFGRQEAPR